MPESKSAIQGEQKLEHTGASHAMGSSPKAVKALYFFTAGLVDSGGSNWASYNCIAARFCVPRHLLTRSTFSILLSQVYRVTHKQETCSNDQLAFWEESEGAAGYPLLPYQTT